MTECEYREYDANDKPFCTGTRELDDCPYMGKEEECKEFARDRYISKKEEKEEKDDADYFWNSVLILVNKARKEKKKPSNTLLYYLINLFRT